MARVIALNGEHVKKINNNFTVKLKELSASVKQTAQAFGEVGKDIGSMIGNAAVGAYETGVEAAKIITGNAYEGAHTEQKTVEPVAFPTNKMLLDSVEPVYEPVAEQKEEVIESTSNVVQDNVVNQDDILSVSNNLFLDDEYTLHQAYVSLETAKARWDRAASILDGIDSILKKKNVSDNTKAELAEFSTKQRELVEKLYDEYLLEEARFDVVKEKILLDMNSRMKKDTMKKTNDEYGNIVSVDVAPEYQNMLKF